MKKGHPSQAVLLGLSSLLILSASSSAQITFERTYGGSNADAGLCVQLTTGGGYIITGYTGSFGAGSSDIYLIKADSLGDTLWTKTYGGVESEFGHCVQTTSDGGYVIAGNTYSFGAGSADIYLVKTDSMGDTLWTKTYGGSAWDCGYSVQQTWDGGYILAGEVRDDIYLLKTDSLGDSVWARAYGAGSYDTGRCVQLTADGGYIIVGAAHLSLTGRYIDVCLVKTNSQGDSAWTRTHGGSGDDFGFSVQQTLDRGYIAAGYTESFGAESPDVYLVRTDSLGDTLWTKIYIGPSLDCVYSVQRCFDGGYIVAGETWPSGGGWADVYLIKTDSEGDSIWTRVYGGHWTDRALSTQPTPDGGYIFVGFTRSFGAGSDDVYVIKTDENGLVGVQEERSDISIQYARIMLSHNHPNPFHRSTSISYSLPQASEVTLSIYDITGRLVETLVNETQQPGIHQVRWNREENPSGVYFYRLKACPERSPEPGEGQSRRAAEFVETRKMVVE